MRWDPCLLDGWCTDTSAISSPSRLELGKEVYYYTKSFLSGGRIHYNTVSLYVTWVRFPKKEIKKKKDDFRIFFGICFKIHGKMTGGRLVGWWYGSCKVIKLWRWCPIYRIGLSNPQPNNQSAKYTTYTATDLKMPADPLKRRRGETRNPATDPQCETPK